MKGTLCVWLLLALQSASTARAYEADIHYSTTYVLARAAGWAEADALTIASANQAVDENHDTVAALEVDATRGSPVSGYSMRSFRQAEKNLKFHCFSEARDEGDRISLDVRKSISRHFAGVPEQRGTPRGDARRLIALGVALHCLQDAHSHVGFGGSCGSYSGNCHGHAFQTLLDRVAFRLLKKHYFDPDHPAVSGERLLETLQETARELTARRSRDSARSIPAGDLLALTKALRESGLDLPDDLRRRCNRHIAGRWLHEFLRADRRATASTEPVVRLSPAVAATCGNVSLASATIMKIPDPRLPRLDADASPYLVRADGTYLLVREGAYASAAPRIHAHGTHDRDPSRIRVQLSHWSHLPALAGSSRKTN